MKSFDSAFHFTKKENTASAYLLAARDGAKFPIIETPNSKGETVIYLTKMSKGDARRKPSHNLAIPKINAKKLGLASENLSGVFGLTERNGRLCGFGDCRRTGNGYLFSFSLNFEDLVILVFNGQHRTVEPILFSQMLDGEFDSEIGNFSVHA